MVLRQEERCSPRQQLPAKIRFNQGVPDDFGDARGEPGLLILDDLLNYVYSKHVCDLFTRVSHHRNIIVNLITQNIFHQGRFSRNIPLKVHYIVALKNVRDKKQCMYLPNQVYPERNIGMYNAYLEATQRTHGYLIFDLAFRSKSVHRD